MSTSIGYKLYFIGDMLPVPFPKLTSGQIADLVTADAKKTGELTYTHFSVFLSKSRRFPFFTATNIDGHLFKKIPRKSIFPGGSDQWSIDERATEFQWGPHLYSAPKSDFQRGHMTKREDPQWGDTEAIALKAARATFHFSNCVPQVGELNTQEWGKLETYILEKVSVPGNLKICVFTGPILADEDPAFVTEVDSQEVQLPTLFWKIVYYTEDGISLSRAGFLMGQENILFDKKIAVRKARPTTERLALHNLLFQDFEDAAIYQVNIATIEQLSNLSFAAANEPYHDSRPLKLIVKKVQMVSTASTVERLSELDESGEKIEFANIQLRATSKHEATLKNTRLIASAAALPQAFAFSNSGPDEQYTDEMKDHFGYYAAWNPGVPLALGDVGILDGNLFIRISDIASLGLQFDKIPSRGQPIDLKYATKGSVSITTKLEGSVPAAGSTFTQGDAGIGVAFSKQKSVLFQANECTTSVIKDTIALGKMVLELYEEGKWDKHWVLITELVEATSATILISNSSDAKIELKANANVHSTKLDIADARFEFTAGFSHAIDTEIVAKNGLTPLFRVMGIKTFWFSDPVFKPARLTSFDALTPSDLGKPDRKEHIQFGAITDSKMR